MAEKIEFWQSLQLPVAFNNQNQTFSAKMGFGSSSIFLIKLRDFKKPISPYLIDENANRIIFGEDAILVKRYSE